MSILSIFNSLASSVFADWQQQQYISNAGVNPMVDARPQLPQAESFPQAGPPLPQEGYESSPQQPYQGGFQGTLQMPESESFPQSNIPEFEETLRQPTVMDVGGETPSKGGEIAPWDMSEEEFKIAEGRGMGLSWKNAMKLPDGTIIESSKLEHGDMIPALEEEYDVDAKDMERGWTWKGFPKEKSYIGVPDVEKAKGSFYQAYKDKYKPTPSKGK